MAGQGDLFADPPVGLLDAIARSDIERCRVGSGRWLSGGPEVSLTAEPHCRIQGPKGPKPRPATRASLPAVKAKEPRDAYTRRRRIPKSC